MDVISFNGFENRDPLKGDGNFIAIKAPPDIAFPMTLKTETRLKGMETRRIGMVR
jgi:hypothetical protein